MRQAITRLKVSHRTEIYAANGAKTNSLELKDDSSPVRLLQKFDFNLDSQVLTRQQNQEKLWKEQTYMSIVVELIIRQFQFIEWYSSPHPMSTERGRIGMNEGTTGELSFTWMGNVFGVGMIELWDRFLILPLNPFSIISDRDSFRRALPLLWSVVIEFEEWMTPIEIQSLRQTLTLRGDYSRLRSSRGNDLWILLFHCNKTYKFHKRIKSNGSV